MRLAYVNYLFDRDTAFHHVEQFSAAARNLGHEVEVASLNLGQRFVDAAGTKPASLSWARTRGFLKQRLGRYLHEPKEIAWNVRYVAKERGLLRRLSPDVLLVRDYVLTASCVPVSRQLGLPLILEVNSPAQESRLYEDEYAHIPFVPEWLERWKLRNASRITVVSSALRDHLTRRHGVDAGKFVVNPNGADTTLFHPGLEPDPELRARLQHRVVIGFVGSFQKWHGSVLLGEMINRVADARPAASFLMVGDGPERPAVEAATAHLGERVLFLGRVPHERVSGLVGSLDIGVMPESNFYGSPLKVIEWMAAAKCVVAPRYGPLEEVIDDGVHGLLFAPGEVEALVAQVLRLVDERELREKLGEAAAQRVIEQLTWEHNAQRVLASCAEALAAER